MKRVEKVAIRKIGRYDAPYLRASSLEARVAVGRTNDCRESKGRWPKLRGENKDVTTSLSGGCKITVEREQNSKEGWEGNK